MENKQKLLFIGLIVLMLGACCNPKPSWTLNVNLRPQQTSMWCWAASGQMCMEYIGGSSPSQCTESNNEFNRADCCNNPTPGACVNGGWPEFDKYGYTFARTSGAPLSWTDLKNQLYCQGKPFCFSWHWTGGGGHMMVVIGYSEIDATNHYVLVNDPWAPNVGNVTFMTYDNYVSGSDHTHWDDFYNITKK